MIWSEHHAEGRKHGVIAAVVERQVFGVGDMEVHLQALGGGTSATFFQQLRHVVCRRDFGKTAGSGERGIAVAGIDIEHTLTGADIGGLGQGFTDELKRHADDGKVAAGPGRLLTLLDSRVVGFGGNARLFRYRPGYGEAGHVSFFLKISGR